MKTAIKMTLEVLWMLRVAEHLLALKFQKEAEILMSPKLTPLKFISHS